MSQVSDAVLEALISGTSLRTQQTDINAALLSLFSGSSNPSLSVAYMLSALTGTPNQVRIRNPSNDAWLKFMEVTDAAVTLFSGGSAVLALDNTAPFTEGQTIDKSGSAGLFTVRSNLTTGVVASVRLGGENGSAADVDGLFLDLRMVTNTASAENFELDLKLVRAGTSTTICTFSSTTSFASVLNAGTLRQGGSNLNDIVNDFISAGRGETTLGATLSLTAQTGAGFLYRKTATGASTVTIGSQPRASSGAEFINDASSGNISFVSAASPNDVTIVGGATLVASSGNSPFCGVRWFDGGAKVKIFGENT